ncbi:MAG TPA: MFS transporter [Candidatus Binataceae bacterium]|jgi:SHS family lactate transporter-like MFS transporter|nr:MFS transporter [Candidatus Binataceae bacterium]
MAAEITSPAAEIRDLSTADAVHTLIASFLGWALDAFDFFVLIFVLPTVAKDFHRSVPDIAFTITATLAMRPVGALIFGWAADRYGRRRPLMIDVIFYSIVEVLSGLAPSYGWFLFFRALYGVGMGGEWGVGASIAMEAVPARWRGLLSGVLQEGYAVGYLLAAAAYFLIFPRYGWRPLFFLGGIPALLTLYIRARVPESKSFERNRPQPGAIWRAIRLHFRRFLYVVALMTMMNLVSHGTQDMYPTFLKLERGLDPRTVGTIAIIYNVGALLGGLFFGYLSDRIGRRRAMIAAVLCALAIVPLWIYPHSLVWLTAGAFMMQFMVQGAWGAIPAHLIELSPSQVRGLFSGLAYQFGVLLAANAALVEALIAEHLGYATALAVVAAIVLSGDAIVIALGGESKGADLHAAQ